MSTQFQECLDAIGNYYGTGTDAWSNFYKYGIAAHDVESTFSQLEGWRLVKNNAGEIIGYESFQPATLNTGGVASQIDSNVISATQANGNTFDMNIPASGTVDQSGNIQMTSGAKRVSDGATVPTVATTVTTAIAGLSFGTKLGTNIVQAIYNSDPDFWDNDCPYINPQTWDTIATTKFGKWAINALFGIDKDSGNVQMYLPEDALDYYAYMFDQEHFFTGDGMSFPDYSASGTYVVTGGQTVSQIWAFLLNSLPRGVSSISHNAQYAIDEFISNYGSQLGMGGMYIGAEDFSGYSVISVQSMPSIRVGDTITLGGATRGNVLDISGVSSGPSDPWVFNGATQAYGRILNTYIGTWQNSDHYGCSGIGATAGPTHEGTSQQQGAVYPDTTGWTSPQTAGESLRQQMPSLYDGAIYTDNPQPDGTTKRVKYIPVNTTSTTGSEDKTPVNNNEVTYNNLVVNESTSPDDVIKTIVRYLMQTQSQNKSDTPNPPDTPNPTNTGTGDTPTIVMPTGQASALWSVYNPSQAQLNSFGAWLWSSNFIDQILKLFNNPMQSIIGVHKIFATPATSGAGNITVGYLDSGVSANLVSNQYTDINCGTVNVREQFGNVFDYTDTHIRLYLPFVGIVDLDTADVMRGTVNVVYHVDVITGACLAEVKVARDASGGTLYQFAGDAAVRYPISSGSYMGVVSGILSAVGGVASAVMTGGATLPLAAGAVAGGISGAHTQVQHSGNFSGNAGAMGGKKPYIIIERPQSHVADDFKHWQGLGANARRTVGQMSGYFKFSDVHTESISKAAESEIESIRASLESGVIA